MSRVRCLVLIAALGWSPAALAQQAVADEPAGARRWRGEAAVATGFDNVGGIGTEGIAFGEIGGRLEYFVFRHLVLGAGATPRQDIVAYDYAWEERIPEHSPGVEAHPTIGIEWASFALSMGPRFYGDGRLGHRFRMGFAWSPIPFDQLRMRFGCSTGRTIEFSIGDAPPFTATGGLALRLTRGFVAHDHHHSFGAYYNILERSAGVVFTRDTRPSPANRAVRVGVLLGTDAGEVLARLEAGVTLGYVWY